jgi:hypothetical protein
MGSSKSINTAVFKTSLLRPDYDRTTYIFYGLAFTTNIHDNYLTGGKNEGLKMLDLKTKYYKFR